MGIFYPNTLFLPTKKNVNELKSLAKKAETVWLASDEDRERTPLWHLANTLKLKKPILSVLFFTRSRRMLF